MCQFYVDWKQNFHIFVTRSERALVPSSYKVENTQE